MKKIIAILITLLFLLPAVSIAKEKQREKRRYNTHEQQHSQRQYHHRKYERVRPNHEGHWKNYRRGESYMYRGHPYKYRGHYAWKEWYGGPRYQHPHGRYYHDTRGQLMFSFCEQGACFSFSIGD